MNKFVLPGTDLDISEICLGTQYFGTKVTLNESYRIMDEFHESGGNILDTALIYSDWLSKEKSMSEKTIGRWIKERNNRNSIVIGTKGAHPRFDVNMPRLSRSEITEDLNRSLVNLQVDCIDIYWLHRDDPSRPVEDILETLESFVQEGKILCYGCSNWSPHRMAELQKISHDTHYSGIIADQTMWNLAVQAREKIINQGTTYMNQESYTFHKNTKLTAFCYSPQAGGYFSKREKLGSDFLISSNELYNCPQTEEIWLKLQELMVKYTTSAGAIALAYLLCQPDFITIPIIGCSKLSTLKESLEAIHIKLSEEDMETLNHLNLKVSN